MATPYDEFEEYQTGDDWDYNPEMNRLFEDRIPKDTLANRPSTADVPDNARYHATDEDLIYKNDPVAGWIVTGHGTSGSRVPEGYFGNVDISGVLSGGGGTNFNVVPDSDLILQTHGGGGGSVAFYDRANGQRILTGNAGGNVEIPNGNLDLADNVINSTEGIYHAGTYSALTLATGGGGSGAVNLWDNANGRAILEAHEGGDVEIPNGNFYITKGSPNQGVIFEPYTPASDLDGDIIGGKGSLNFIVDKDATDSEGWRKFTFSAFGDDPSVATRYLTIDDGDVKIPNGDLRIPGNHLRFSGGGTDSHIYHGVNTKTKHLSSGHTIQQINNSGEFIGMYDNHNGQYIAQFNEGGTVDIPNGKVNMARTIGPKVQVGLEHNGLYTEGGTADQISLRGRNGLELATYDGSNGTLVRDLFTRYGRVEIPNGDLNISGDLNSVNDIYAKSATNLNIRVQESGQEARFYDDVNNQFILRAYEGGTVEIPNGDLDVTTNEIQFDAGNTWRIGGRGADNLILRLGGSGGAEFTWGTNDATNYAQAFFLIGDGFEYNRNGNKTLEIPNGAIRCDNSSGFQMPNRGGSSDTQATQIDTTLTSGVTEIQATDGAGNTTTLT